MSDRLGMAGRFFVSGGFDMPERCGRAGLVDFSCLMDLTCLIDWAWLVDLTCLMDVTWRMDLPWVTGLTGKIHLISIH